MAPRKPSALPFDLQPLMCKVDQNVQRINAAYTAIGYSTAHSALVAVVLFVYFAALMLICFAPPSGSSAEFPPIRSYLSFHALCVAMLMSSTLLFRLMGGQMTRRSATDQASWMMGNVLETLQLVLAPTSMTTRVGVVVATAVIAEIGKHAPVGAVGLLLVTMWINYLLFAKIALSKGLL